MKKKSSPGKGAKRASKKTSAKKAVRKSVPKVASKTKPSAKAKPTGKAKASAKAKPFARAKRAGKELKIPASGSQAVRMAAAKKIEAVDSAAARASVRGTLRRAASSSAAPERISDFPNTYIAQISVRLEDPDHPVTLTWTGPNSSAQETGPFRSSPGAGLRGFNCDDAATSRRNGSNCTPKGTFTVTGFAPHLSSHPEATDVTWFVPARGIALHYYPSVPTFAASHGCVRLEKRRVAQLIQSNSRVSLTSVTIDGTWTKPAHQY